MRVLRILLAVCAIGVLIDTANAQELVNRKPLWFGVGYGVGNLNVSCGSCSYSSSGLASHSVIRAGVTVSHSILIGFEFDRAQGERAPHSVNGLHLTVYGYPTIVGPFLKAGMGLSFFDTETPHSPDAEGYGTSVLIGIGYELRVTGGTSLTPTVILMRGRQNIGSQATNETAIAVSIGVMFN